MKKNILLVILSLSLTASISSQTSGKYNTLIAQANSLYENRSYKQSAKTYSQAFASNSWKGYRVDRYNAARAWTLAGNKDSAFYQLFKVADAFKYDNYDYIAHDSVLTSLYKDERWEKLLSAVKKNIGTEEAKMNKKLLRLMDSVYHDDQAYRFLQISIDKEYGADSEKGKEIRTTIRTKDSINESIVTNLLDNYGWLSTEVVGSNGNATLALVLQHSSFSTQKKYLPMMREAVKNKKADAYDLALIEDKVALKEKGKQIYGTYLIAASNKKYFIAPIENPEQVDKRRAELNLVSMNEYLKNWGMHWDIRKYEEDLLLLQKENINY
ncbi:MAG: hypothetical protein K0Q95_760 [Bacteroidota bacterium]|jgi:hypothetical protein|nr:hypothetical protein [Bacteroidota bacterium]